LIARRLIAGLVAVILACPWLGAADAASAGTTYTWRQFANTHPAPLYYQASGIAAGSSGNIFVADIGDHRVEKFGPTGTLAASWGTDTGGPLYFSGPRAIAINRFGNLFVADNGVVKLSSSGKFLSRWTGGVVSYPRGLAVDAQGTIYVLSLHPLAHEPGYDRITITRLSPTGKRLGTVVYRYTQVGESALGAAIATTPQNNLLLSIKAQHFCRSCDGTYYLLRTISPQGKTISEVSETAGGQSIAVDSAGEVFLTAPNAIQKLSPDGTLLQTFGTAGCGVSQVGADLSLAVSPLGSLFVADSQGAAIRPDSYRAPISDGVIHVFGLDGTPQALLGTCPAVDAHTLFGQINAIAAGGSGTVYVADGITSKVSRVAAGGRFMDSFEANHPSSVSTDAAGNVYVANLPNGTLQKRTPSGRVLASSPDGFIEAAAVAPSGNVYALDAFGHVLVLPPIGHGSKPLRKWSLNGYAAESGGLDPVGICLDGQGNVWAADIRHNNLQKYSPSGRLLLIFGRLGTKPRQFHNPGACTVDGRGHIFVDDIMNDRVQEFDLSGRFLAAFGRQGQAPGQFQQPEGIAADAHGNIYIGDRGNDRIQELVAR
jgi:sugar lactone lactonase YvrE